MTPPTVNDEQPIKLVLLGGSAVGKSTFANRLHSKFFRETYYPTHKSTVLLFPFTPTTRNACTVLDEYGGLAAKKVISQDPGIILSPTIFQTYNRPTASDVKKRRNSNSGNKALKNKYYAYKFKDVNDVTYTEPEISPIQVEIIDTPPFKPDLVVPFLEVSLYRNLDKNDLHNLANEPRRPVSTNPLLVASGASELDGKVNGYIFMYSAVPTLNPPSYDEILDVTTSNESTVNPDDLIIGTVKSNPEETLGVLELIRGAILDAWREYRNYQKRWKKGSEGDVYSLVYTIKQMWKMKSYEEEQKKLAELRNYSTKLDDLDVDPSSPFAPPPILICCTHASHAAASPSLIERGKQLSRDWNSSFIAIDNETGENVEETVSLIIREILEREKLQKVKKATGI